MTASPFSLEGKTILITGASSGIGRATAILCAQLGGKLIITGRDEKRLQNTYHALGDNKHKYMICDLTNSEQVFQLVENIDSLNGIVYCAGTQETCITKMLTEERLHHVIDTNFISVALLNAAILSKKKISRGGAIVLVSSVAAHYVSEIGNAAYSASKGALSAFGRVLATELAIRKIRVNMVAPAMVRTPIMDKFDISEEQFIEDEKKYPLGYGEPEDVANAIAFLLSDASKWITGSEILIDGGLTLH